MAFTPKEQTSTSRAKLVENSHPITTLFRISTDDIPFETAKRAHNWTSMDPETRAVQSKNDYYGSLCQDYESLLSYATEPQQVELLNNLFPNFAERYKKAYLALLNAKSRTASTMVTGGSNFNISRNQKALNVADARMKDLIETTDKGMEYIRRAIEKAESGESKTNTFIKEITRSCKLIIGIDNGTERGTSRALIVANMVGKIERKAKTDIESAKAALSEIRKIQNGLKKPILSERNKIWELESKTTGTKQKATEAKKSFSNIGLEVWVDPADERIKFLFDGKPDEATRNLLKRNAFKWSPKNSAWQRQTTANAMSATRQILAQLGAVADAEKATPKPKAKRSTVVKKSVKKPTAKKRIVRKPVAKKVVKTIKPKPMATKKPATKKAAPKKKTTVAKTKTATKKPTAKKAPFKKPLKKLPANLKGRVTLKQLNQARAKGGIQLTETKKRSGQTNIFVDVLQPAKRPGKRLSANGSIYYENRMNRSDRDGGI